MSKNLHKNSSSNFLSWTWQRSLWRFIARSIGLQHTIPLLTDEVEFFLFVIVLYLIVYKYSHSGLLCGLVSASALHVMRGLRWQLIPLYSVILSIVILQHIGIAAKVIFSLLWTLSLFISYHIPANPPIKADSHSDQLAVGLQDVVLEESGNKFIVRFYYPIDIETDVKDEYKRRPFYKDALSLLFILTGVFGIPICDPNSILESAIIWSILAAIYYTQQLLEIGYNVHYSTFFPEGYSVISAMAKFGSMPTFIMSHFNLIKIHAMEDAPISKHAKQIVIFHSGLAGVRGTHVSICMKLASQGYFVIYSESSDRTPILSILPPNYEKRPYYYIVKRNEDIGHKMSEIEAVEWRQSQMNTRARESTIIMQFLQSCHLYKDDTEKIFIGYPSHPLTHPSTWTWSQFYHMFLSTQPLQYSTDKSHSLFWKSLMAHQFTDFSPILVGHSYGGATVLHMMSEQTTDVVTFRNQFPIAGIIAQDPWTTDPLSDYTKYMKKDSIFTHPVMIMYAEYFGAFQPYDIIDSCQHILYFKMNDCGHHSFNEFAFSAPYLSSKLKNIGKQDPIVLLQRMNHICTIFCNQIVLARTNDNKNQMETTSSTQLNEDNHTVINKNSTNTTTSEEENKEGEEDDNHLIYDTNLQLSHDMNESSQSTAMSSSTTTTSTTSAINNTHDNYHHHPISISKSDDDNSDIVIVEKEDATIVSIHREDKDKEVDEENDEEEKEDKDLLLPPPVTTSTTTSISSNNDPSTSIHTTTPSTTHHTYHHHPDIKLHPSPAHHTTTSHPPDHQHTTTTTSTTTTTASTTTTTSGAVVRVDMSPCVKLIEEYPHFELLQYKP